MNVRSPKVSVLMVTYNHEKFIKQAVNSVLMQSTNFFYELVIGEDFSTDNTRIILNQLTKENPNNVRLLANGKNVGSNYNYAQTLEACKGEYIAILDGDDYWVDPSKLQMQVDFLESHKKCSSCFTNAVEVDEDAREIREKVAPVNQKKFSTLGDILQWNFIPNCTVMFRKAHLVNMPEWFFEVFYEDWAIHVINVKFGPIGYIDQVTAAYRKHSGGIYTALHPIAELQHRIADVEIFRLHTDNQFDAVLRCGQKRRWSMLSGLLVDDGFKRGVRNLNHIFISGIFDNWPRDLPIASNWKRHIFAGIYEKLLFEWYHAGNLKASAYCCFALFRYDPARFLNRGVLSILSTLIVGEKIADIFRSAISRLARGG